MPGLRGVARPNDAARSSPGRGLHRSSLARDGAGMLAQSTCRFVGFGWCPAAQPESGSPVHAYRSP